MSVATGLPLKGGPKGGGKVVVLPLVGGGIVTARFDGRGIAGG